MGCRKIFSYLVCLLIALSVAVFALVSCESCSKGKLVAYRNTNVKGYKNKPVLVDTCFVGSMDRLNNYARQNDLTLYVTSSFRKNGQKVTGTIVPPSTRSNHLIGHAVDINIKSNGKWYDSKKFRRSNLKKLPNNIQNFFNSVRKDKSLRWGGDFKVQDPVHIDDYYNKNYNAWQQKYRQLQS